MLRTKGIFLGRVLALFTVIILLSGAQVLSAAYFEFLETEIELPNGEVIPAYSSGDEFFNWVHDEEGYTLIIADDGYYYYGIQEGETVVPSQYRVNSVDPSEVGIEPWAKISERLYQERKAVYDDPMDRSGTRAPHTGTMSNLVIYIRFSNDSEFTTTRTVYDNRMNSTSTQSLKHYFQEVSYGQLDIQSHHYPISAMNTNLSYQDSQPRNYYRPYNASSNPIGYSGDTDRRLREHNLLRDAVNGVSGQIPSSLNIDADGDGYVDNVCFIIKGNSGNWADLLWAHRWVLYSYNVYINNKRVYDYTFQPENQTNVSTLAHEMFHTLGAPDLYRYNYDGYNPVGPWDLMSSGFVHMGAWMKYKYANQQWISSIPEINSSGNYTLNPITDPVNNAYRIASPYTSNQFFVVEYRKQIGLYESGLPGSGLLIYRINANLDGNAGGPPDEVYVYRHNGTHTATGSVNTAAYSNNSGRTEINDVGTNPTSFLSNGSAGGLNIHSVGEVGDTITFSIIMVGDLAAPAMITPENNAADVAISPIFSWSNINVADYYTIQIAEDTDFNDIVFSQSQIINTNFELPEPLGIDRTYFWRVSSSDSQDTSDWSQVWSFSTSYYSELPVELPGIAYGTTLWGDFDNDGFLDLFISGNNYTKIYKNMGNGEFSEMDTFFPALRNSAAALGDLNNNGLLDIVITGRDVDNRPQTMVYYNLGNFGFGSDVTGLIGVYNGAVATADYNNDGLLDFVVSGTSAEGNMTALYRNDGYNNFTLIEDSAFPGVTLGDLVWGDINNNGRQDLFITGLSNNGAFSDFFINIGDDTFIRANMDIIQAQGSSASLGDFNQNGYLDLLIMGNSVEGLTTRIYRNMGDESFVITGINLPGIAMGTAKWADFDMDGKLDILITGMNQAVLLRNSEIGFQEINSGIPPVNFSSAAFADIDNDGDLDIVVTGNSSAGVITNIYQNNYGDNIFVTNSAPTTPTPISATINECSDYCSITFSWQAAFDSETPQEAITYNLSIGSYSGGEDIVASMSDLNTGFRKTPLRGNAGNRTELTLQELPLGEYYWRVQAVDGSFVGSPFSEEQQIIVTSADNTLLPTLTTKLNGNYPNPFNPETKISFTIGQEEHISLQIFNIKGELVATLMNEKLPAGKHSLNWTAEKISSGIYFYRLSTPKFKQTRKMLLLK